MLHPTYYHCRSSQTNIVTADLHIKQQALTSMTNPGRQTEIESTNSMTIRILRQIQAANNNYKNLTYFRFLEQEI